MARAKDIISERTCFNITDYTLNQYSEQFRSALKNAIQAREDEVWSDNFIPAHHQEFDFAINTQGALDFLGKYNFTEKTSPFGYDEYYGHYGYKCFFNYHDKQYIMWFVFKGQYSPGRNPVNVNFTDSNSGPIITKPDVTVYLQFNGTVLFNNNLNHYVILTFTFVQPSYYGYGPDDIRIPPRQTLHYDFDYLHANNRTTYQYLIRPDNLQGSVTAKNPEKNCLTVEEAKSLYSLVNVTLKFPQYLPDDYRYKCGRFVAPSELDSFYGNRNAQLKIPILYSDLPDFYKKGGLTMYYEKTRPFEYNDIKSQIEAEKNGTNIPNRNFTEINGNPAMLSGGTFLESDVRINSISIYTMDDHIQLNGNFTIRELKKIAESIR